MKGLIFGNVMQENKPNFNKDNKPKKKFGGFDKDRPKRPFKDSEEKPFRKFGGDKFKNEDRPRRTFGDSGEKPFRKFDKFKNEDRPRRTFGDSEEKPDYNFNKKKSSGFDAILEEAPKPKKKIKSIKESPEWIFDEIRNEKLGLLKNLKEEDSFIENRSFEKSNETKFRINRYLARCGLGSRRDVETFITNGEVKVNGEVVTDLGYRVDIESDKIEFKGEEILFSKEEIILALNKPSAYLCSHHDVHHEKTVFNLLPEQYKRLYMAGRLDLGSRGLMVFSNDGELINQISHPSMHLKKVYIVKLASPILDESFVELFLRGFDDEGEFLRAEDVEIIDSQSGVVKITLKEGRKRQIHRMFKSILLKVVDLQRIQIGELKLENQELKEGEFKIITRENIFGK